MLATTSDIDFEDAEVLQCRTSVRPVPLPEQMEWRARAESEGALKKNGFLHIKADLFAITNYVQFFKLRIHV